MKYTKPHLSYEQQAARLIARGLKVDDREELITFLKAVNYYRLSAYWRPFINENGKFIEGTNFSQVKEHYRFDRQLRVIFVDAIEHIEIALRTQIVFLYTEDKSPFAYVDERFPRWEEYEDTIKKIENRSGIKEGEVKPKCRYTFIKHFYDKYGDSHQHLPFWMFIDLVDFSFLSFFLKNAEKKILARVAKDLDLAPRVLVTWLHTLNTLRNSCAHHSRVWNERWGTALMWPSEKGNREWYYVYSEELHKWILPKDRKSCQPSFPSYKTSALIFICRYLLKKIAPKSQWYRRVEKLFEEYANKQIDWKAMGFQTMDWQSHPLWRD